MSYLESTYSFVSKGTDPCEELEKKLHDILEDITDSMIYNSIKIPVIELPPSCFVILEDHINEVDTVVKMPSISISVKVRKIMFFQFLKKSFNN